MTQYKNYPRTEYDEDTKEIRFFPCVYQQRYTSIHEILSQSTVPIKQVVDFGCAGLGFFTLLKSLPKLELVMHIDIDEDILNENSDRIKPLLCDHLSPKPHPFRVQVFSGSIAEPDPIIIDVEAIVCIEVIEHLYPTVLEELPNVIFGVSQPTLAIFTTPNVEYNVLFPDSTKPRHPDHKFEWTRKQFQDWASNLCLRFQNYTVAFKGVGPPPVGHENIGYATQMAIFTKLYTESSNRKEYYDKRYKLLYEEVYPIKCDNRSTNEKVLHEIQYRIIRLSNPNSDRYDDYCYDSDDNLLIPLKDVLPFVEKYDIDEEDIINIMADAHIMVNTNKDIIVTNFGDSSSSSDYSGCDDVNRNNTIDDINSNAQIEDFWD